MDRVYIGHTQNLKERLHRHNTNRSSFTRNKGPWTLIYSEEFPSRSLAMKREQQLKKWNRTALKQLMDSRG